MNNVKLEVVNFEENREVTSVKGSNELALGETERRLFVRSPSGTVHVLKVSEDLMNDVMKALQP